ncbi:MAG: amidohydrolase family protein [Cryobacterium sp.]
MPELPGLRPGEPVSLLLRNARLPGGDDLVNLQVDDGRIRQMAPAGTTGRAGPGAAPEVVDLGGRFVIPGLWDNHVHFTQWAQTLRRLNVAAASSAAAVADLVAAHLAATGGTGITGHYGDQRPETLIGFGFRDALWADAPSRAVLDAASASAAGPVPVVLVSADLHSCWLNTAALEHFGFAGHPTGLLREADSFRAVEALDTISDTVLDDWAADAARAAAARGVVGIVDLEMTWNLESWQRRMLSGTYDLRVEFGIYSQHLQRAVDLGLASGQVIAGTGGLLQVGPYKVITDGSLNTRTAYCLDPYPGHTGTHTHGQLTVPVDALRDLLRLAVGAGLRPAVHAIGDHANRLALDAFATLRAEGLPHGGSIEHAQLLGHTDVRRFAELGIVASVQPEHALDDREVAEVLWAGRTERAFPLASLLEAGVELAFGSDAPVAPLDPWISMAAAVGRSRDGSDAWHSEQAVSRQAALAASTRGLSRVRVGQTADLAVCEIDPLAASVTELRHMPVAATLLGGRFTHRLL